MGKGHIRLQVVMLGTGSPIPHLDFAETSVAVLIDDDLLLFDCGYGTTYRFLQAKIDSTRLRHLFFTHHHYDHNAGYAHLVLSSWVVGRSTPIAVYGPEGTAEITRLLFKGVYAEDIRGRATAGRQVAAVDVAATDIDAGYTVAHNAWRVSAFRVSHGAIPALGYKIEAHGKSVVISGDTVPVQAVVDAARGADLLIHEVMFTPGVKMQTAGPKSWEEWVIERGHCTPAQVGQVAAAAGVPRLVLTHLFPVALTSADQLTAEVRSAAYDGEIIIAQDLMQIEV